MKERKRLLEKYYGTEINKLEEMSASVFISFRIPNEADFELDMNNCIGNIFNVRPSILKDGIIVLIYISKAEYQELIKTLENVRAEKN